MNAARAQQEDGTELLIQAAIADFERIAQERSTWVGRPNPEDFNPDHRPAAFPVLDEETAIGPLPDYIREVREGLENYRAGLQGPLFARIYYRWGVRLNHTAESIAILHLEFQKTQHDLEERRRRDFNDVDDDFAARLLGGEEQAAFRALMRGRIRALHTLSNEKQRLAREIEAVYGTGQTARDQWLENVQGNAGDLDLFVLGSLKVQLLYHTPDEDDLYGVPFELQKPDGGYIAAIYINQLRHPDFIEPRIPFPEPPPLPEPELHFRTQFDTYLAGQDIGVFLSGDSSMFVPSVVDSHVVVLVPADSEDHPFPRSSIEVAEEEIRRNNPDFREIIIPTEGDDEGVVIEGDRVRRIDSQTLIAAESSEHAELFTAGGLPAGDYEARLFYVPTSTLIQRPVEVIARHPFTVVGELEEMPIEYPSVEWLEPRVALRTNHFGLGMPTPRPPDWHDMLPEDLRAQFNEAWVLIACIGHAVVLSDTPDPPELAHDDPYIDEMRLIDSRALQWGEATLDERFGKVWDAVAFHIPALKDQETLEGEDSFIVMAKLKLGSPAGAHAFTINGVEFEWTQREANAFADVDFVRDGQLPDTYDLITNAFLYDKVRVRITTTARIEADELPFIMMARGKGDEAEPRRVSSGDTRQWSAQRSPFNPLVFYSEPFFLNSAGRPMRNPHSDAGVVPLNDEELLIAQVPRYEAAVGRRPAVANVTSSPGRIGESWLDAIVRAARVGSVALPDDLHSLTYQQVGEITQSGVIPGTSEFNTKMNVGDLAALLLLRDTFVRDLQAVRDTLFEAWSSGLDDPDVADTFQFFLMEAARGPESRVGSIMVPRRPDMEDVALPELANAMARLAPGSWVPLSFIYDHEYIQREFRSRGLTEMGEQWKRFAVKHALGQCISSIDKALARARGTLDHDIKGLMRLTSIGFESVRARIRPNFLRLQTDAATQTMWWEVDRVAQAHLDYVGSLHGVWNVNEEIIEKEHEIALVVSMAVFVLPEYMVFRIASTAVAYALVAESAFYDIPKYFAERAEVEFARSASFVIGEDRLNLAEMNERSPGLVLLNFVGSVIGVPAEVTRLVQLTKVGTVSKRGRALLEAVDDAGLDALVTMSRSDQAEVIGAIASAEELAKTGTALSDDMTYALKVGDDLRAEHAEWFMETLDEGTLAVHRRALESTFVNEGVVTHAPTPGVTMRMSQRNAGAAAIESARRLTPNQPWQIFDVGDFIGQGAYAQVYEINGTNFVLKVFERGEDGADAVRRSLRAQELLGSNVPQLRIVDSGELDGIPYLVQELIPRGSRIYERGEHLPRDAQEALLVLYKQLGKAGLGWEDGHRGNLYFFPDPETGRTIAGVLDQDRIWHLDEVLDRGALNDDVLGIVMYMCRNPSAKGMGIHSLADRELTPAALELARDGYFVWPNGEYTMMKMLEHKGWIKYNRKTQTFEGRVLDMDLVRKHFPQLDAPQNIDTVFDVPARLRGETPQAILLPSGLPRTFLFEESIPVFRLARAA